MHPAAFYFYCTYTHGTSLRIIINDYIITQTLINETALNCGFNWAKTQSCNLKQFHSLIFCLLTSTQNIRELTSTYMLYSNQLLVYQFNTLWDGHIFMSSEKHPSNSLWYKFTTDLFFCVCGKTEKTLNI